MAMTEPGISAPASPSDVGRHLRAVRKARGLSRTEVARSAGLTRRELAAYERGRSPVPDSDLWCLAGSCGVDVGDLLPPAGRVTVGSDLGALTVGESIARLRPTAGNDGVLREYLAMVYELRNLPPGAKPPMREEDLATLAEALGGTPEAIEVRLHELIGASREEAARLRSLILPPRPIAAPAAPPPPDFAMMPAPPVPVGATVGAGAPFVAPPAPMAPNPAPPADPSAPWYPAPAFDFASPATSIGDADAADRFFSAPHAEDPFAPPPPLEALAGPAFAPPAAAAFPPPVAFPAPGAGFAPPVAAAFAPPTGPTIDPFAPPSGPPLAPAPAAPPPVVTDPFAGPPTSVPSPPVRPDGFVADLGTDLPDATLPAHAPPFAGADDPAFASSFGFDESPAANGDTAGAAPDPFGGTEMVVLDVGPDGTVVDPPAALSPDADRLGDDDPLAILRIPIDEADAVDGVVTIEPSPLTAAVFGADAAWDDAPGADGFAGSAPADLTDVDPFADAYDGFDDRTTPVDPEVLTARESLDRFGLDAVDRASDPAALPTDDDPGDDWFDRAAAAADALIAEQRHDEATPWADLLPDEQMLDDRLTDEQLLDDPQPGDPLHADEPPIEAGTPTAVEADPGPPPIAWSLTPPPDAPVTAPTVPTETSARTDLFVAAGSDWQVGGIFPATAMADDGALALRRADVRWALADVVADGDFTIRATVTFTSGAGFGLLFRVSTDDSERITGYSFDVDPIYSGGGFLVRQWNDSRQHWKPLAHAPVADTARLYGAHQIEVSLRNDTLTASIDGESVMHVAQLSRSSIDAGHEPCRGGRIGVQAWSTTEVTVDRLLVAHH